MKEKPLSFRYLIYSAVFVAFIVGRLSKTFQPDYHETAPLHEQELARCRMSDTPDPVSRINQCVTFHAPSEGVYKVCLNLDNKMHVNREN